MLIGIISDTHDNIDNLDKALDLLEERKVEIIYHCGDWVSPFVFHYIFSVRKTFLKFKGVLGNNEGSFFDIASLMNKYDNQLRLEKYMLEDDVLGKKISVYHGYDEGILNSIIDSQKYDLVFTGHTHQLKVEKKKNTLVINPGTLLNNFIAKKASFVIYDCENNNYEIINL